MILILILLILLYILYRHWDDKKNYWRRRGIGGPEAEFVFGNLRGIWDTKKPRSLVIKDWTSKYGKVYGIHEGYRKILVISDIDMMNELLVKKYDNFNGRIKSLLQPEKDGPKTNLVEARGIHWKRLRALGTYAFTNKSLKHIQSTVDHSSILLIDELMKKCEDVGSVDMLQYYQEYTMDIICKVALGMKDVQMFNNPLLDMCKAIFAKSKQSIIGKILVTIPIMKKPIVHLLAYLAKHRDHPYLRLMRDLEKTVEDRKKERESLSPSSGDFIDIFLDSEVDLDNFQYDDKTKFSRKLVFDEITTANSLSCITHFLANYPDVQEKIFKEIENFDTNESIEYDDLIDLPYTECVIKESLRHFPIASFVVNRECSRSTTLGGIELKEGDLIQTDTWSMHMDKEIWGDDAEEFRPERWLEKPDRARIAFQSFGEGPRLCLGQRLAFIEIKTALIRILRNFRIEKNKDTNPLRLMGSMIVTPERVMVTLKRR